MRLERQLGCLGHGHLVMRDGSGGSLAHALVVCAIELLLHVVSVSRSVMCGKRGKGLISQVGTAVVRRRRGPGVALIARVSLSLVGVKTVVSAEACLRGVGWVASSIRHNPQVLFARGNDDSRLPKRSLCLLGGRWSFRWRSRALAKHQ